MNTAEDRKKVAAEPCRCVHCSFCGGTGRVYYGEFVDAEPCESCFDGIVETCDRCQLLQEMDWED